MWDTAVPIFDGKAGTARIGLSEARMRATVATITMRLLLTTALVSLVGILAAIFLTWLLTRPVRQLVEATEAVRRGDFSPRVRRWADDELGELADAFNTMTADLAAADAERQERGRSAPFICGRSSARRKKSGSASPASCTTRPARRWPR